MQRAELEHLIRAAGMIVEADHIIVIGSQAILASFEEPPPELTESIEADLFPRDAPEAANLIDGSIGELSMFHESFGYYAHGVGPETATLADGWENRLVAHHNANTRGITGWCLAPIDIAFSKLAAGRDKDIRFIRTMLRYEMLEIPALTALISEQPEELAKLLADRLIGIQSAAKH